MTAQNPPQQLLAQVNQLAGQKRIKQALAAVKDIHNKYPAFAPAWLTGAFLFFQNNQINQARRAIKKARELEPDNALFAFQEVMMLDSINEPAEALPIAKKLAQTPLPHDNMNEQLARFLEINYAFKEAGLLFKHLSQTQPHHSGWLLKQAMIAQNFGRIEQAAESGQKALALNPLNADVWFFLSHLKKQKPNNNHINKLTELSQRKWSSDTEHSKILFSLAKELEDIQQYRKSFRARKKAADLYRSTFQYDINSDVAFMRQIQQDFDASFLTDCDYDASQRQPIFIVGLPRSGTTLLDRIISSHDEVTAAGELKHFNRCLLRALQQRHHGQQLSRTEMVTASSQLDFKALGEAYLKNARTSCGETPRFTDKFPQNSYYVGMILKALPGAKVIIMQRHPVSVCYSVYKQMFNHESYPFSYDLSEMADYYIAHNQLLNHWQNIAGNRVKTVYYEDLVADLETQARSVLSFLDLSWQDQCLEFHKNKQAAATASASQVRQKVYTDSVAMWQNYETELQPLISKLKAAGCLNDN